MNCSIDFDMKKRYFPPIYPSSVQCILHMVPGKLESIPEDSRHKVGDTLDRVPTYYMKQSHTLPSFLFSSLLCFSTFVKLLWYNVHCNRHFTNKLNWNWTHPFTHYRRFRNGNQYRVNWKRKLVYLEETIKEQREHSHTHTHMQGEGRIQTFSM